MYPGDGRLQIKKGKTTLRLSGKAGASQGRTWPRRVIPVNLEVDQESRTDRFLRIVVIDQAFAVARK